MYRDSLFRRTMLFMLLALLLTGCAGTVKNMREVPAGRTDFAPEKDKAMIVFMRPSGMAFAIQSSVFEIREGVPTTLAGIVAAKTKVAYSVDPGQHLFMVVGENGDFMTADVQAGKTYYAYIAPRMGLWKARFAFEPKHMQDLPAADFSNDLAACKWVEKSADSEIWMQENIVSIKSKYADYYPDWQQQPEAERSRLLPEDGR